jgi:hypothetical protein
MLQTDCTRKPKNIPQGALSATRLSECTWYSASIVVFGIRFLDHELEPGNNKGSLTKEDRKFKSPLTPPTQHAVLVCANSTRAPASGGACTLLGCRCFSLSGTPLPAGPLVRRGGHRSASGPLRVTVLSPRDASVHFPRDASFRPCTLPPVAAPLQTTWGRRCGLQVQQGMARLSA